MNADPRWLAQAISGRALSLPATASLVDTALDARLGPLLASLPISTSLPDCDRRRLAAASREAVAHGALLDRELVRAVAALDASGIRAIAFKGAHLAHALYPEPHLRPRTDVDLLVAPVDRTRASVTLAAAGYTRPVHVSGTVILGQFHVERTTRWGGRVPLDVHWRPFAPLVLCGALDAEDLFRDAATQMVAGVAVRVPSVPHALALAVLHLAAHHGHGWDLLWLNDVRLLAAQLAADARRAFARFAQTRRFSGIAAAVTREAGEAFEDATLCAFADDLRIDGASEPSMALLDARRTPMRDLLLDLRVAPWRQRLTLLREHVLPPSAYFRARSKSGWLPLAYARRAVRGARRWSARPRLED